VAQHDFNISNQSAPNFRADLNDALEALATLSSGGTAPSTTYANMLWYDTDNNILKMRTEADDAWIDIGTLNQSTNTFEVAGLTTLSEATWETGTSTTEALVSPAKIAAAIDELTPPVTITTNDVLTATAGAAVGGVGTYIFAQGSTADVSRGGTIAGSSLLSCSAASRNIEETNTAGKTFSASAGGLAGTWRCMGTYDYAFTRTTGPTAGGATLWLRIS
jgi:hypothetical protein